MEILTNPLLCRLLVELFATDADSRTTLLQVVDRLEACSPEERRQVDAAVVLAEARVSGQKR
ncbi:MAG TPA: hypothetical protein VGW38_15865 [Chloroflexota bacterium]|nr:hypothetical protein [Chloroflexota bacterium]